MDPPKLLEAMHLAERLKNNTRHSWTSTGRRESVAEHSWRLCLLALLVGDEFPGADMDKVLRMCVVHDLGEAFTGDIPAFEKTAAHEADEAIQLRRWAAELPEPYPTRLAALFDEMDALQTTEAKIYKALDKLEAIIQHNEADISTWLPLEYDLQLTYGAEQVQFSPYLQRLREQINADTRCKIAENEPRTGRQIGIAVPPPKEEPAP